MKFVDDKKYPKITVVTPCLNASEYIEKTILSVLQQGYPNLEYIVVDGGSKDGTVACVEKYKSQIFRIISECDQGIYDALNKGFSCSSGELMGWLNAGDILHANSLFTIGEAFLEFPDVRWMTGIPTNIDEIGRFHESRLKQYWVLDELLSGKYGAPQQESTYWRRSLWEQAGASFLSDFKLAGDFDLWCRFFEYESLVSIRAYIGGFRKHQKSLSVRLKDQYEDEIQLAVLKCQKRNKPALMNRISRIGHRKKNRMLVYNFNEGCFKLRNAC